MSRANLYRSKYSAILLQSALYLNLEIRMSDLNWINDILHYIINYSGYCKFDILITRFQQTSHIAKFSCSSCAGSNNDRRAVFIHTVLLSKSRGKDVYNPAYHYYRPRESSTEP